MLAIVRHRDQGPAALLTIGVLALALVTGCGSSKKAPAGTVSAESYVGQVCTSLSSWFRDTDSRVAELEGQVKATTPQRGKQILESSIAVSISDSQTAISALQAAGSPDVANGQKIASLLIEALERNQAMLRALQPEVAALPANDAEAVNQAAARVSKSTREGLSSLASGQAAVSSPELAKAAAASQTCKSVGARPV
jgi:hypothetical protein